MRGATSAGAAVHRLKSALLQGLKLFAGLKSNRLAWWDGYFGASTWVAPDAGLARPDREDAKAAKLNAIAFAQRLFHGLEHGLDRLLGFLLHTVDIALAQRHHRLEDGQVAALGAIRLVLEQPLSARHPARGDCIGELVAI